MTHENIFSQTILSLLAAAVALLSFSCSNEGVSMKIGAPSSGVSTVDEELANVRVAEVTFGEVEERIILSGEVYATGRVNVVPDTNGLLTRVLVNSGATVAYNQIIAYVDPSKPGMSYAESPVRAKASGTVTAVHAVAGNQVSVQSVIAEVGDLDRLEIETRVPEKYLADLHAGMGGWIRSRAFPDEEVLSRVTEVSPVVDPRSRTILVTLVPESTERLRPGQAVSVDLVLQARPDAVTVPAAALTERNGGFGVFVVGSDSVAWRPVSQGSRVDGFIEVTEGLVAGEIVVVAGQNEITDGTRIRVVEG